MSVLTLNEKGNLNIDGKPVSIYSFSATGLHFVNRDGSNLQGSDSIFGKRDLILKTKRL